MSKIISPCVGVCKYKLKGRCSGCGMKKAHKGAFKKLESTQKRQDFLATLILSQKELHLYQDWVRLYRKKCKKRGKEFPLQQEIFE